MHEHILLISSEYTSANYSVLVTAIKKAYPGCIIHYLYRAKENLEYKERYEDNIFYIPIHDQLQDKLSKYYDNISNPLFKRFILYLNIFLLRYLGRSFFYTRYEKLLAKSAILEIDKYSIDKLFTSNNPYTAHKAGLKIVKARKKIKWFQFWLDPFCKYSSLSSFSIQKRNTLSLEQKLLDAAFKIFALPEAFANDPFVAKYSSKINFFEIPYITHREIESRTKDIIYSGSFAKGLREPEPVFEIIQAALSQIDNHFRFVFFVKDKTQFNKVEKESNSRIIFKNYVSRNQLSSILSNSYALLNIGNINSKQMPSKVVEYISYRKPTLFFYSDKNDPSFRYYNFYSEVCPICLRDQLSLNVKKLVSFVHSNHSDISYNQLMEIDIFRESTPEFLANMILDKK